MKTLKDMLTETMIPPPDQMLVVILKGCTATVSSVAVTVTIDTDWRVIGVTCQSEN